MKSALIAEQKRWLVLTAWMGLVGATLMFVGDLLLYAHFETLPLIQPLVEDAFPARTSILLANDSALTMSALLGPLSAVCYLGGSAHYALLFHRLRVFGVFVGLMSALAFTSSGAYHAQFGLLGHILAHANTQAIESEALINATQSTMFSLNVVVQVAWFVAFSALLIGILKGLTVHPRWMGWFTPLVPVVVLVPIVEASAPGWPTPWSSIAAGGIYNLLMALSFVALILAARRIRPR